MLKIAVVGMGVSGSYLVNQLSRDHDVVGFERYSKRKYQCVCAWGTSKDYISEFARNCDLDFDDYVLEEGRSIRVSVGGMEVKSPLAGLVSFDKHRLLEDMRRRQKVKYGIWVKSEEDLKSYDLIIDSTGLRVLLPKTRARELRVPCVQYRVEYEDPPFDDFYLKIFERFTGYLWYFPIGNGVAHVGAGDYDHGHIKVLEEFLEKYGGRKSRFVGRSLKLTPPRNCLPFHAGKVVGVGESIGTVVPLLGEGIIPALECSELLLKNLENLSDYRREVLRHFAFFETAYHFLDPFFRGEVELVNQARLSLEVLTHMWENQFRYGFKLQISDIRVEPLALLQQAISLASMVKL